MSSPLPSLCHRDTKETIPPDRIARVQAAADGGLVAFVIPPDGTPTTDGRPSRPGTPLTEGRWIPVEVVNAGGGVPQELLEGARAMLDRINGQLDKAPPATDEERAAFLEQSDRFRLDAQARLTEAIDMFHELPLAMREDVKRVLHSMLNLLVLSAGALAASGELLRVQREQRQLRAEGEALEREESNESDD